MLISAIITEIVLEVGGDSSDSTFSTNMLTFLKAGLRRIPAFIRDRVFITIDSVTLSSGSATASLSGLASGLVKERAVWYVGDNNARIPIHRPPSINFFHENYNPSGSGAPQFYHIYGSTIEFDKKANQAYTIGLDYFKEVSSIVAGDTFIGNEQMLEAVKDFCKMVYYRGYEEDEAKASQFERTGKELIAQLQEEYEDQELGTHIEERSGDY